MKILQLSPRFPLPPDDGGKIVLANTFKYLSKLGNSVHLFCFEEGEIKQELAEQINNMGVLHQYKYTPRNSVSLAAKALMSNKSVYIIKHYNNEIFDYLCKLHEKEKFDVIHCEHSAMATLGLMLKLKYGVPFSIRLHNIEYRIWELYAKELSYFNPLKYFIEHQYRALRLAEINLYQAADACFAITEDDRQLAKKISPKANVFSCGVGVDLEKFKYSKEVNREPNSLILATTYKWVHNVDGLIWFIENVLPIVKKQIPEIKLRLLGKEPPEKLRQYSHLGVEVVGYVDDVVPFFGKSSLYIAPLFVGAGVRIKIIEAMATGLPVVATKVSAAGITANESDGLFVSDDAKQTAATIIDLLSNPIKTQTLGERAHLFVKQNFSWESNVNIMHDVYEKFRV